MPRLLVINPNTTEAVTTLIARHALLAAGPGVALQTLTARFGAPYISCEASYAVAGHAVLDAWARFALTSALAGALSTVHPPAFQADAVLIGCFGDPGLFALREVCPLPVTGLAEAAFTEAQGHGRFAVVTGGTRWRPMLERLALSLGLGDALAGIHTVHATGAQLAQDPVAAHALLLAACQEAQVRWNTQSVILGGAGLAGLAAPIAAALGFPVIDSVAAGTRHVLALAEMAAAPSTGPSTANSTGLGALQNTAIDRTVVQWTGVSAELTALGLNAS